MINEFELYLLEKRKKIFCERKEILYAESFDQYVRVKIMYKEKPEWASMHVAFTHFKQMMVEDDFFELNFYSLVRISSFIDYRAEKNILILEEAGPIEVKGKLNRLAIVHLHQNKRVSSHSRFLNSNS